MGWNQSAMDDFEVADTFAHAACMQAALLAIETSATDYSNKYMRCEYVRNELQGDNAWLAREICRLEEALECFEEITRRRRDPSSHFTGSGEIEMMCHGKDKDKTSSVSVHWLLLALTGCLILWALLQMWSDGAIKILLL